MRDTDRFNERFIERFTGVFDDVFRDDGLCLGDVASLLFGFGELVSLGPILTGLLLRRSCCFLRLNSPMLTGAD